MRRWTPLVGSFAVVLMLGACTGTIGESPPPASATIDATIDGTTELGTDEGFAPDGAMADAPSHPACDDLLLLPGRAPLRRLTVTEYDNSVADLFGDHSRPAERIVDDERGVLLADSRVVTMLLAEQYMNAAEDVAARLTSEGELDALLACDRAVEGDDVCARQLIERIVPQVYRRPAEVGELRAPGEPTEVDRIYALYEATRDEGFAVGIATVLEAMLQSPSFLYRPEFPAGTGAETVRLNGYELATRLSYFFWSTTPDAPLTEAAASGALDTLAGIELQARRLVADPRAEEVIQRFISRYLGYDQLEELEKDAALFPAWNDGVPDLFREETRAFVHEVLEHEGGSWVTLMTAPWSMMNDELAAYYGVSGPQDGTFERVDLDPQYHSGMMTHGGTTSIRARTYETSPIHRGMFIRGNVMCDIVPDVPEGLDTTPPAPDPTMTTRERLAAHRADPYCASCHDQLDPLGFAFEHFDAAGRFRPDEDGLTIDATGMLTESDVDGDFDGVPGLAARLVSSAETQACFAHRWFPAAFGRGFEDDDPCAMQDVMGHFAAQGFDIRELLVALATSELFLYRVADQDTLTEVTP